VGCLRSSCKHTLTPDAEFSGTLLGFDDYVSKLNPNPLESIRADETDMVLEDVTEL
jgi:hypothetical protein